MFIGQKIRYKPRYLGQKIKTIQTLGRKIIPLVHQKNNNINSIDVIQDVKKKIYSNLEKLNSRKKIM